MNPESTTSNELGRLARRFAFNRGTILRITEVFEPEDWSRPASPSGGNDAHWIVGHLAATRRAMARRLGAELPEQEWEAAFDTGQEPPGPSAYPPVTDLLADLEATQAVLDERLPALRDGEVDEPFGERAFPDGTTSLADGLHFLFFHEAYHIGQLGLLRRAAGKPGFV